MVWNNYQIGEKLLTKHTGAEDIGITRMPVLDRYGLVQLFFRTSIPIDPVAFSVMVPSDPDVEPKDAAGKGFVLLDQLPDSLFQLGIPKGSF